jgi:hypothetical protein
MGRWLEITAATAPLTHIRSHDSKLHFHITQADCVSESTLLSSSQNRVETKWFLLVCGEVVRQGIVTALTPERRGDRFTTIFHWVTVLKYVTKVVRNCDYGEWEY